jgi:hypothetical protein
LLKNTQYYQCHNMPTYVIFVWQSSWHWTGVNQLICVSISPSANTHFFEVSDCTAKLTS